MVNETQTKLCTGPRLCECGDTKTLINQESEAGVTTDTQRRGTKARERTPRVHIKAENGLRENDADVDGKAIQTGTKYKIT